MLRRFLPRHNRRFVVSAPQPETAWVEWPKGRNLDEFLCFKYRRAVLNDNTVRIGQHVIDIPPAKGRVSYAHARVECPGALRRLPGYLSGLPLHRQESPG